MREFIKPVLISSKCIEFEPCRYNGLIIRSSLVKDLKKYAEFKPICPEMEIGLGVPRDPVRIIKADGKSELYQPATDKNLTLKMKNFSNSFVQNIDEVDGFILKNKSPTCGIKNVKRYQGIGNQGSVRDGIGLFAGILKDCFPFIPIEDEGRLRNLIIRENFLTKIFTLSDFRKIKNVGTFNDLVEFHSRNKLLLLSYNEHHMRELGRILSNGKRPLKALKRKYENLLLLNLSGNPKITSNINVLMHSLGYFSDLLSHDEKIFFLENIQKYREGHVPLFLNLNLLKSWIIRFKEEYLYKQTFFQPYPEELMHISFINKLK